MCTDHLLFFHVPEWKLEDLYEEGAGEILCGVYKWKAAFSIRKFFLLSKSFHWTNSVSPERNILLSISEFDYRVKNTSEERKLGMLMETWI